MKKILSLIIILFIAVSLFGCIRFGVYLKDGTIYHEVKWYKSRTQGVYPNETSTGTVIFLTQEYGVVEVPWDNVDRIQTE